MQYNTKELLEDKEQLELTWHGEPTRVLVRGQGEKTEVPTGGTLTVSRAQAVELLKYSPLWTLAGDKPQKQPYMQAQAAALKAQEAELQQQRKLSLARLKSAKTTEAPQVNEPFKPDMEPVLAILTQGDVDAMKTKKQVVNALKERKATFNESVSLPELKVVLLEREAERQAAADKEAKAAAKKKPAAEPEAPAEEVEASEEVETTEPTGPKMVQHTVTQEDLDLNPEWVKDGIKVGEVIEYPEAETETAANSEGAQA